MWIFFDEAFILWFNFYIFFFPKRLKCNMTRYFNGIDCYKKFIKFIWILIYFQYLVLWSNGIIKLDNSIWYASLRQTNECNALLKLLFDKSRSLDMLMYLRSSWGALSLDWLSIERLLRDQIWLDRVLDRISLDIIYSIKNSVTKLYKYIIV